MVKYIILSIFLVGCASKPLPRDVPVLVYEQAPPLSLPIMSIDVIHEEGNQNEVQPGQYDRFFQKEIDHWANTRFSCDGNRDRLKVTVEKAHLQETPGLKSSLFSADPGDRYDATIALRLDIQTPEGESRGFVKASAAHMVKIPSKLTLAGREQEIERQLKTLMNKLDQEVKDNLHHLTFISF
jgi:hypothetical protein